MKCIFQFAGLALLAALASPAFAQQVDPDRMVRPYWWDKPVVEALGRALVEVQPNRASFGVEFVETSGDSGKAMEAAVANAKLAREAIKKIAGDKARVKTSVSVSPYYEQYKDKDGNIQENERADRVKGYEGRASLDVTLTDIALAGRARGAALALKPQSSDQMRFYLDQTIEMQRDAMKVAAQDARARAEITATAAGGKLGDLLVLQEGQGPCLGSWSSRQVARQTAPQTPGRGVQDSVEFAASLADVIVTANRRGGTVTVTEADVARLDLPSDNDPQTVQASMCAVYTLLR
jgi:uncharacterized protein YggE